MRQPVAFFAALRRVDARRHADAIAARPHADADTDAAALAAVLTVVALRVLRRLQQDVPQRIQAQVAARLQLAALHEDVARAARLRADGEVIIGGDWLTESGIVSAEQPEVSAPLCVLELQRREVEVFKA